MQVITVFFILLISGFKLFASHPFWKRARKIGGYVKNSGAKIVAKILGGVKQFATGSHQTKYIIENIIAGKDKIKYDLLALLIDGVFTLFDNPSAIFINLKNYPNPLIGIVRSGADLNLTTIDYCMYEIFGKKKCQNHFAGTPINVKNSVKDIYFKNIQPFNALKVFKFIV